jgi:hypothetical protein
VGAASARPAARQGLVATLARDPAGDVLPEDRRVEALGDRFDLAATQRVDPLEYQLEVGLCLVMAHRFLL